MENSLIASASVGPGQQDLDVRVERPLAQQVRDHLPAVAVVADDDPRRVQVVVQRAALAQELRAEHDRGARVRGPHPLGEAHRHGRLDDQGGVRGGRVRLGEHGLDRARVEEVRLRVVVGRCRDQDDLGVRVRRGRIGRRGERELVVGEVVLELGVLDRRLTSLEGLDLVGVDVQHRDVVALGEEHGVGQPDVPGPDDGDLHPLSLETPVPRRMTWTTRHADKSTCLTRHSARFRDRRGSG